MEIRWEYNFWSFGESHSSPIEAPNIEFPNLKRKILHIWNMSFAVEMEQLLALFGWQIERKNRGSLTESRLFLMKNMVSLGDSSAENEGLKALLMPDDGGYAKKQQPSMWQHWRTHFIEWAS